MEESPKVESGIKRENLILDRKSKLVMVEGKGRGRNLEECFQKSQETHRDFWDKVRGGVVYVKPNVVDPDHPDSCTQKAALFTTLNFLAQGGAKRIIVGDIPNIDFLEKKGDSRIRGIYNQLGYLDAAEAISANWDIPVDFVDPRERFPSVELSDTGLKAYDLEGSKDFDAVVNLTLPKKHGQYYFTACGKNLMGLTAPEDRKDYFHQHGTPEEIGLELVGVDFKGKSEQEIVSLVAEGYIRAANRHDPANDQKMARFIEFYTELLSKSGIEMLNVVDGTTFMTGNEHVGTLHEMDLAVACENPIIADASLLAYTGSRAGYIEILQKRHHFGQEYPTPTPKQRKTSRIPR